ncbi:hypothetical protein A3Q56_07003 [Intoshia linei]|uniref:Uncharacterized protein n=1 Tax=Intoshia linei TaxID=1819745 RepID=A0A177AVN6_9BILA|nr:hypothetical protein A3Q56_07003 [Intoshia linei]
MIDYKLLKVQMTMLSTNQADQWKMLKEQLTNDDFVGILLGLQKYRRINSKN